MREAFILRDTGEKGCIITYNVYDFPIYQLNRKCLNVRRKTKNAKQYVYTFATFDLETTTIEPDSDKMPYGFMYHWQMDIGGLVVTGRTWEEWLTLMNRLQVYFELSPEKRFVIYVHNLAFEFQFIRDFLKRDFDGFEVFARSKRKPMHVRTGNGFEFRCSYIMTNMSLDKACKNEYGIKHPKAAGDLDYKKLRTPTTYLDDTEFGYCVSDVVSLYELISCRLINDHDNIETIPLTSTGYVRRECRKAVKDSPRYHDKMKSLELTTNVYTLLKEAGRGGNTHANRYMSGKIWNDCDSDDVVSSYPAQIELRKFPMTKFSPYGQIETVAELRKLIKEYACLFRISFINIQVRKSVPMPYIPSAKCLQYSDPKFDNGRILSAEYLKITINDIDFKIIEQEYTWEACYIEDMHIAKYDYLPEELRNVVMQFFRDKCDLKDKIKALEAIKDSEGLTPEQVNELDFNNYLYAKSKNRLNGIFGMMYTDPVRTEITINSEGEWIETRPDIEKALHKAAVSRNNFVYYAWGVWVTTWARLTLEDLIIACSKDGGVCIYCDTDSSKSMGANRKHIDALNNKIMKEADKLSVYYDLNGRRYYMGVYEHENKEPIKSFVTLGAKKYCYEDADGLHVTISGVNKKRGAGELKDIHNFKPGFVFHDAGGNTLYYNDEGIHYIDIEGDHILTGSSVGITDSTYEIGITGEYADLIGYGILLDKEYL